MIRRPPRSTPLYSSAASDVYKRQLPPSALPMSVPSPFFLPASLLPSLFPFVPLSLPPFLSPSLPSFLPPLLHSSLPSSLTTSFRTSTCIPFLHTCITLSLQFTTLGFPSFSPPSFLPPSFHRLSLHPSLFPLRSSVDSIRRACCRFCSGSAMLTVSSYT